MANLTEVEEYTEGIYQFETTDPVQGGPGGIDNMPTSQLANRTKWLKARVAELTAALSEARQPSTPRGGIIMFGGEESEIPAGWALCDGRVVLRSDGLGTIATPDLSGRFVIGASPTFPLGSTGGSSTTSVENGHTHTASSASAGSHSHGGATGGHALTAVENGPHTHDIDLGSSGAAGGSTSGNAVSEPNWGANRTVTTESSGSGTPHTHPISSDGGHTHAISMTSGGAHSHTLTPPYYTLAFIMCV